MSTVTRPELSERNRWWISKHRYYELRHFCLQYQEWQKQIMDIDGLPTISPERKEQIDLGHTSDLTPMLAEARMFLSHRVQLVESAAYEACQHQFWYTILIQAVTEGASYDILETRLGIMPVSRNEWYDLYRRFFWTLDKMRE